MRIVGGQFKGRVIVAPEGKGSRPTTDRMRETLFNVLEHADWTPGIDGLRVLDLYAGSGALGFEALSRGALFCLFVETAAPARGAIRRNIETLGLFGQTRLHRRSATDLGPKPASLGDPFALAFLDPPYGQGLVVPTLETLVKGNWLCEEAIVVVETEVELDVEPDDWNVLDVRTIASSKVTSLSRTRQS